MTELADLTATDALHRIREGRLRAPELIEACLHRAASLEPTLHVFAHHDPALARAAVPNQGALHGLPIGVKDVLDTADQPSQYGSPIWDGYRPHADAACVAWARAEGAVVMGKTVTTEFATRKPGPTANPHNRAHTPGGSSSGSAAGVAAGYFPIAFGTQTGGSIIRPAAYCGVVGYKPGFGTIARQGMKVMSESLDTIGAMARSVADCALLVGAVAGRDLGVPDQAPGATPRIGLCPGPYGAVPEPETADLMARVAGILGRAGAAVRDAALPQPFAMLEDAHPVVMNVESARSMGWEMTFHRDRISPVLRQRLEWGLARPEAEFDAALAAFGECRARFADFMRDFDVLVTPSAQGEAPAGLDSTGEPVFNGAWTALGVPCVTVPAGTGPSGLPLGIQIVAPLGHDRAALAWARWVQAALEG